MYRKYIRFPIYPFPISRFSDIPPFLPDPDLAEPNRERPNVTELSNPVTTLTKLVMDSMYPQNVNRKNIENFYFGECIEETF